MIYKYTAIDAKGARVEADIEADNQGAVITMLRQNRLIPIKIEEDSVQARAIGGIKKKVKIKELAIFSRQFEIMLQAGIGIVKCLDILEKQTINRTLSEACGDMSQSVQKGNLLSKSMEAYPKIFPPLMVQLIVSGESSGNLDVVMGRIATNYEKDSKTENKIKNAMMYPIVLGVVLVVVMFVIMTFVLPKFTELLTSGGGELPLTTKLLIGLSDFMVKNWYFIILGFLLFIAGLKSFIATPKGRYIFDGFKLKIPFIKTQIKMIITARFTRTLATLLGSGIQLLEALKIVSKVSGNVVVEGRLGEASEEVKKGMTLSRSLLDMDIFPPMMISMVKIGEESGSIDTVLNKTADFYDEELDAALQRLVGILEPAMIVIMGVCVSFVVIAIMGSMYSMYDTF